MEKLGMHYLDRSDINIADTFDSRVFILDWIDGRRHEIRRTFRGMFSPADSALSLLQIIGIDSHVSATGHRRGGKPSGGYKELTYRSGFTPYQVFCYEDEIPLIKELIDELAEKFPFDADDFENGTAVISPSLARIGSYASPVTRRAYMDGLIESAPKKRERLRFVFPTAFEVASKEIESVSGRAMAKMDEPEIRKVAGRIIESAISTEDFESGMCARREPYERGELGRLGGTRMVSTIATWLALADDKHVVEGLRDVMEDPFLVLMSLHYRGEEDDAAQEHIDFQLRRDTMLRGYMGTYIYALLFGLRCVSTSYDDFLYDLYSSRMWELFALCGKDYVRGGGYEHLASLGMKKMGYPMSTKTLEDVVRNINWEILNNRSED